MKKTAKILRWTSILMGVGGFIFFACCMRACTSTFAFPKFIVTLIRGIAPAYPYLVVGLFVLSCLLSLWDYLARKVSAH